MAFDKKQIAKKINQLAKVKAAQKKLDDQALTLSLAIKHGIKHKGEGESKHWIAMIVNMPRKTMVVKAHDQLHLIAKKSVHGRPR